MESNEKTSNLNQNFTDNNVNNIFATTSDASDLNSQISNSNNTNKEFTKVQRIKI